MQFLTTGSSVVKNLPSNTRGASSIPGQRAKIPHASESKKQKQNTKQKQYCNKLNKDFKMVHVKKKYLKKVKCIFTE